MRKYCRQFFFFYVDFFFFLSMLLRLCPFPLMLLRLCHFPFGVTMTLPLIRPNNSKATYHKRWINHKHPLIFCLFLLFCFNFYYYFELITDFYVFFLISWLNNWKYTWGENHTRNEKPKLMTYTNSFFVCFFLLIIFLNLLC